jgi:AraC-like DNA-binding protein
VARRCGFDSENYFRQQFRERYGMSPRQFRTRGDIARGTPRRLIPQAQTA